MRCGCPLRCLTVAAVANCAASLLLRWQTALQVCCCGGKLRCKSFAAVACCCGGKLRCRSVAAVANCAAGLLLRWQTALQVCCYGSKRRFIFKDAAGLSTQIPFNSSIFLRKGNNNNNKEMGV
jgi:hypothetical protein